MRGETSGFAYISERMGSLSGGAYFKKNVEK